MSIALKPERLEIIEDNDAYTTYRRVPIPCIPLMVDQGGYHNAGMPVVIERLKRKKLNDRMWLVMQYHEDYGIFKGTLVELKWNGDKTKAQARFTGDIIDKMAKA